MIDRRIRRAAGAGLLLSFCVLAAGAALAQVEGEPLPDGSFLRYGCGSDLKIRGGATLSLASKSYHGITFVPDFGWTGDLFLARHDLQKGWTHRAGEREYNAFCYTAVGTGLADPPGTDDLILLSEKNAEAVYQLAMSSQPDFLIAHGLGAAFALKARCLDKLVADVLVFIDPLNPQDIGDRRELSYAEARARGENLEDRLWVEWGIGPKPGVEYEDSEIGREGFERLLERYEPDQPAYWANSLTGFDGGLVVGSGVLLRGLSVLIVGTPGRDGEQRRREDDLIRWLREREVWVDRLELADLQLPGLSRLPMAGDHADLILDKILDWGLQHMPVSTD